jgi:hypothetical protein
MSSLIDHHTNWHREESSPVQGSNSNQHDRLAPHPRWVPTSANSQGLTRIAVPTVASRISIERYLNAPLADEPATAPAIDAALRRQVPLDWIDSPATLYHSRETSVDVHSNGRRTFFTTGSIADTVDTSYTLESRSRLHRTTDSTDTAGQPNTPWLQPNLRGPDSPIRPVMGGAVGPITMAREWAESVEKHLPNHSPAIGVDYRAKAEQEIWKIQEKAKELELLMRQFKIEGDSQRHNTSGMTDESARAMMAANPKLAWILGGDTVEAKSIVKSKTMFNTTDDIPNSPNSVRDAHDMTYSRLPRKSKSSGGLNEESRQASLLSKPNSIVERRSSKRSRFYCTFCHKRFHVRVEWLTHERTIHMPEELWVCCPRTGEFPKRCPFCEKVHPSPAHLADHNYISCQEKPLSERTFGRKDYFLQHISQIHKVSPGQKPARLTELENAWRHPLPVEIGHQALHCGFCGTDFATYEERTTHVGRHFAEGADMMSWWKNRISHEAQVPADSGNALPLYAL